MLKLKLYSILSSMTQSHIKHRNKDHLLKGMLAICIFVFLSPSVVYCANFNLDFQREPGSTDRISTLAICMPGLTPIECHRMAGSSDPDRTPFVQEVVRHGVDSYYHIIIGREEDGFVYEFYLKTYAASWSNGNPASLSGGTYNGGRDASPLGGSQGWGVNFNSPLDSNPRLSGNGTARPYASLFRMKLTDDEMTQETSKSAFDKKPIIFQKLETERFTSQFIADLSDLKFDSLADLNIAGNVSITQKHLDTFADFDLDKIKLNEGSHVNTTAGKYYYNPASGSFGAYVYQQDSFRVNNVNWSSFRDPGINVPDF